MKNTLIVQSIVSFILIILGFIGLDLFKFKSDTVMLSDLLLSVILLLIFSWMYILYISTILKRQECNFCTARCSGSYCSNQCANEHILILVNKDES